MQGNRSRDTSPEVAVRRLLHGAGLRYRLHVALLPGHRRLADIVFTRQRVAVMIDGCYWHGCPDHYTAPKANAAFWREKIERNRARDADTTAKLQASGWTVLRFWTHDSAPDIADRVRQELAAHG